MKIIRTKFFPRGIKAMNLFGVLFMKPGTKLREVDLNHEKIHTAQIKEMLYLFFYVWYGIEWTVRLFLKGNAYRNLSFERGV